MSSNNSNSFKEYQSIDHAKQKQIKKFVKEFEVQNIEMKWVATEKVHGANFSFIYLVETGAIHCGRRNSILAENETFFNYQRAKKKYGENITQFFALVKQTFSNEKILKRVILYGELFGGVYPPPAEDFGLLHIQKGVYYSNDIDFYAFDVFLEFTDGTEQFMDYDVAMELFEKCKLFYAKPLVLGTLEECLSFDTKINSTIPALLGLPALEKNQCEGIVVKPIKTLYKSKKRCIFKIKNEKFDEVNPPIPPTKYEQVRDAKQAAMQKCYDELDRFINENRLISAISKLGTLTIDNKNKIVEAMLADVFKDFVPEFEETWNMIEPDRQDVIRNNTKTKVNAFVTQKLNEGNL